MVQHQESIPYGRGRMSKMRRLMAGAAVATALAAWPAASAVASPAAQATARPTASAPSLPVRVMHVRMDGQLATVTIRGDWKLAHAKLPVEHLLKHHVVKPVKNGDAGATSGNWSGYVVTAKTGSTIRYVSTDFNVPNLNCAESTPGPNGSWYSSWAGLDGWTDGTVEQEGTEAYCSGGNQGLYVFYEMYPAGPVVFTGAAPGDALQTSTYFNSGSRKYSLIVSDLTQSGAGVAVTLSCASTCNNTSAEVVSEAPGGGPPDYGLADFGGENYTNSDVTSQAGVKGNFSSNSVWTGYAITMISAGTGNTLATPGGLEGSTSFLDLWKAPL
jgi:uncharacterized membrane protein